MPFKIDKSRDHDFPKDKRAWANWVNQLHNEGVSDRRSFELQWAINTAYYLGHQNLRFISDSYNLVRDLDDEELIINRIAPFVETRVSKMIRARPIPTVTPDKTDNNTLNAAKISEMVLDHLWKIQKMPKKIRTHALYLTIMGCSFLKPHWDPTSGEIIENDVHSDGALNIDEDTGKIIPERIILGEINTAVKSPFAIIASPDACDVDDATWIIDRTHLTLHEIKRLYPDFDPERTRVESEMSHFEQFVNRLSSPVFSSVLGIPQGRKERDAQIREHKIGLVKEFWLKPNEVYPRGVVATVVGDQLVDLKEFPNNIYRFPFIKTDEKENPFGFYGLSTVTRLVPLQRRYNEARTQISRNAALMANVKWWMPKGHGAPEDALDDTEGEVLETNPNLPRPQQLPVAPMPNYVIESQIQDINDIRDIGGEREASQMPFPGLTAGVALETAAEQADIIVTPILRNLEDSYTEMGRQWLELANEHYDDPRKLKIIGENNQVFIQSFKSEDLKKQYDITVQIEAGVGMTKAAQKQNLIDLWDRRVIVDPEKFLEVFLTGNVELLTKKDDPARNIVIEDINNIKEGRTPDVRPFDNHIMYVRELSAFMQTPEFRRIAPDRQQIAFQTLQAHLQYLQQQPEQAPQPNPAANNTPFGSQVVEGG